MIEDDQAKREPPRSAVIDKRPARDSSVEVNADENGAESGWVIETVICPFHCLYQDALSFHTQSRLARSESEASRIARAALLLYVSSAEALVHQAAVELGRGEPRELLVNPDRPISLCEAWRLLPAVAAQPRTFVLPLDQDAPPWPQFAELIALAELLGLPGARSGARGVLPFRPS